MMQPLPFQIQTCSNTAKFVPVRVAGVENVAMEDNETTFEQLYERIDKTVAFLKSANAKDFEGKEGVEITLMQKFKFNGTLSLGRFLQEKFDADSFHPGSSYLQLYATPNFYFHESMAYAILRKEGVPVGKLDFLGEI